jgi:hypothetical protein
MSDFRLIEELLLELIRKVSPDERSVSASEAQEYIGVDEYGLALETIAHAMVADGRTPSTDELSLAKRIAQEMSLDPRE